MIYNIILSIILSFFFIKFLIIYADKLSLIDTPNNRSSHTKPIPSGAGMGFTLAIFLSIFSYDYTLFIHYWYIFTSILIVLCIGMIDDIFHISPKTKIFIITLAVLLLWINNIQITSFGIYFGIDFSFGLLSLPFTLFAIVGFTNSLNLIDGIDGLAGMVSFTILSFFAYLGYYYTDTIILILSLFTMGALIAFLFFNYHPAQIFMGDSGSLTLGFIIATLALLSLKYVHPIVAIYFTALPLYDTLVVVIRRYKKGLPIMNPDKTHIHHILLQFFGDRNLIGEKTNGNRRTAWVLVSIQLLFASIGIFIHLLLPQYPFISVLGLIGFILGFIFIYKLVIKIENLEKQRSI